MPQMMPMWWILNLIFNFMLINMFLILLHHKNYMKSYNYNKMVMKYTNNNNNKW